MSDPTMLVAAVVVAGIGLWALAMARSSSRREEAEEEAARRRREGGS